MTGTLTYAAPSGAMPYPAAARIPGAVDHFVDRIRLGSLWLLAAISGFVVIEPAPYEFGVVIVAIIFGATGMRIRPGHLALMFLLIFYNIGFATSVVPVIELDDTAKWTAVSSFLSLTSLFFAVVLVDDTKRRTDILLRGYIVAAIITSIVAIVTYFKLVPGWEPFIFALRARSTFKDPNVFGPFLILPALIIVQRMIFGGLRAFVLNGIVALIIATGLFLSFSRGAWGHFGFSALMMVAFSYITTRKTSERLRIIVMVAIGGAMFASFIVALISLDAVAALFKERASLVQNYDAGHLGRFNRHILGALLIFDHPLGVGPLQFNKYFPEDPHNSFLDSFMAGGWLGGFTFLALVFVTLWIGFRNVFVRSPWQPTYIAVYAAFLGEVGESYIIDVQHWRHSYLIMGMVWGLILAGRGTTAPVDNVGRNGLGTQAART
ncbi:MAG TPA: O-antigen ligase family protein [Xanthobacteraceae bacterium]